MHPAGGFAKVNGTLVFICEGTEPNVCRLWGSGVSG